MLFESNIIIVEKKPEIPLIILKSVTFTHSSSRHATTIYSGVWSFYVRIWYISLYMGFSLRYAFNIESSIGLY